MWQRIHWRKWRLIIKLDPDKTVESTLLKKIITKPCIDAILVGGTQNITKKNTEDLIRTVKSTGYTGPLIQEISALEAVSFHVDGYLLPVVLNTGQRDWFIGKHVEAVKTFGHLIDWSQVLPEAYVICNPQCAAAQLTQAIPPALDDLTAYLTLVEEVYRLPILYVEYSGVYGNPDWVQTIKEGRRSVHIFYGGGIENVRQAKEMMAAADTIILGNVIYEKPENLLDIMGQLYDSGAGA